jgi:hypothetical protein
MSGIPDPATPPELTALENALSDLLPRPATVDRDAVLFRAGQAAVPRRWFWPCATAAASAAAVVLGVLLAIRPAPAVIERTIYVQVPAPERAERGPGTVVPGSPTQEPGSPHAETPAPVDYSPKRRLEEHLFRWGFDGLRDPGPDPNPVGRPGEFLSHSFSSMGD